MAPTHAPTQQGQAKMAFVQALRRRLRKDDADAFAESCDSLANELNELSDLARQWTDGDCTAADLQANAEVVRDSLVAEWGWKE